MTSAADWQARVGEVWAAEWRRTDRSFADLSCQLDVAILAAAPDGVGNVLDIGCGAGATSAALAAACPDLSVTGIDLSEPLVEIARARVPGATFRVADVASATLERNSVDLLFSRHGVMFFDDPATTFARLHAAAVPGARLVFSCFRTRAENAFAGDLVAAVTGTAAADPPGYAPGPFAFAREGRVATILAAAGWQDARATPVDFAYVAGEGDDPVADAVSFLSRIGPVASAIAADPAAMRPRLASALMRYVTATRVVLPAAAWIWRATKGPS